MSGRTIAVTARRTIGSNRLRGEPRLELMLSLVMRHNTAAPPRFVVGHSRRHRTPHSAGQHPKADKGAWLAPIRWPAPAIILFTGLGLVTLTDAQPGQGPTSGGEKSPARRAGSAQAPPRIVATSPAVGATEVDPSLSEIAVTFDQDMSVDAGSPGSVLHYFWWVSGDFSATPASVTSRPLESEIEKIAEIPTAPEALSLAAPDAGSPEPSV